MSKIKPWGAIICVDLINCDKNQINNDKIYKKFVKELCSVIKMKTHGPLRIERFGKGSLYGPSFYQFIETSSITAHFDIVNSRAFIDIFSCKNFDAKKAEKFCKDFFKAKKSKATFIKRG